jgi:hypothetical protein
MILSPEALTNFIDLISDGVSVSEATIAIGGSPRSKIAFKWLADSEMAADFDAPPAVSEPWCIVRDGTPQWFHLAYRQAVIDGRNARSIRRTPIRAELEQRLRTKRGEQPKPPGYLPPRVMVGKPSDEPPGPRMIVDHVTQAPVILDPPPPRPRPSYAYRAPPLDGVQRESGPPQEGRFVMTADRPKSQRERQAGTVEITDQGIRRW